MPPQGKFLLSTGMSSTTGEFITTTQSSWTAAVVLMNTFLPLFFCFLFFCFLSFFLSLYHSFLCKFNIIISVNDKNKTVWQVCRWAWCILLAGRKKTTLWRKKEPSGRGCWACGTHNIKNRFPYLGFFGLWGPSQPKSFCDSMKWDFASTEVL